MLISVSMSTQSLVSDIFSLDMELLKHFFFKTHNMHSAAKMYDFLYNIWNLIIAQINAK